MSVFDLKPLQMHLSVSNMKDMQWTYSRSEVPEPLQRRISPAQWARTYDSVIGIYDEYSKMLRKHKMRGFISCAANPNKIGRDKDDAWSCIVRTQADVYRRCGVKVTPVKGFVSFGLGKADNMRTEIIGLRFFVPEDDARAGKTGDERQPSLTKYISRLEANDAMLVLLDNSSASSQ